MATRRIRRRSGSGTKAAQESLYKYHIAACSLHSALFVLTSVIAFVKSSTTIRFPLYYITTSTPNVDGGPMYPIGSLRALESSRTLDFSVMVILIFVSAVTCAEHLYYIVYPSQYRSFLRARTNPIRWISYSLTAPLMAIVLSYFCGMVVYSETFLVYLVIMTLMSYGYWTERELGRDTTVRVPLIPFILGLFVFLVYSCITLRQFFITANGNDVPLPISILVFGLLSLMASFSVPLLIRVIGCKLSGYAEELIYIVLSFSSKSLLVSIWLFTTLRY